MDAIQFLTKSGVSPADTCGKETDYRYMRKNNDVYLQHSSLTAFRSVSRLEMYYHEVQLRCFLYALL